MKALALVSQISALTLGFSANLADAMIGAAIFAVLCVVVVMIGSGFRVTKPRTVRS